MPTKRILFSISHFYLSAINEHTYLLFCHHDFYLVFKNIVLFSCPIKISKFTHTHTKISSSSSFFLLNAQFPHEISILEYLCPFIFIFSNFIYKNLNLIEFDLQKSNLQTLWTPCWALGRHACLCTACQV